MTQSEFSKRWLDSSFVEASSTLLNWIFSEKVMVKDADLRGIVVGLNDASPVLLNCDFQDVDIRGADMSYGKFSCSFSRGVFANCRFNVATFDTCRFKNCKFIDCMFEKAHFKSPTLDDAEFLGCNFLGSTFRGRGHNEYGGRRVRFERCGFQDALFQNLQLRSAKFENCYFQEFEFKKCLLAGVAIMGHEVTSEQFDDCEVIQTTINGRHI